MDEKLTEINTSSNTNCVFSQQQRFGNGSKVPGKGEPKGIVKVVNYHHEGGRGGVAPLPQHLLLDHQILSVDQIRIWQFHSSRTRGKNMVERIAVGCWIWFGFRNYLLTY